MHHDTRTKSNKEIALIAGTRPEVIKMLPVYKELKQRPGIVPKMILTGQHNELAHEVMRIFDIRADRDMQVMQQGQTLVGLAGRLAGSLAHYLAESPPDMLLVQGDTTSAMIAGIFGFYSGIPVGHIEAGLRTGNLQAPFPEEFNRRVLTLAARWHFAPTKTAAANLAKEGVQQQVHIVGNTVIDAALMVAKQETENTQKLSARFPFLNETKKRLVLVTAHRRENFGAGIQAIATAVKALSGLRPDLEFIIPMHPNPNVRPVFLSLLQDVANIHLMDPLGYDEVLFLIRKSVMILTDSGGIQEEAPAFDVPVLVLRNETERPEGIEAGCSVLVGTHPETIQNTFLKIMDHPESYHKMSAAPNPYGDGQASRRIVDILLQSSH